MIQVADLQKQINRDLLNQWLIWSALQYQASFNQSLWALSLWVAIISKQNTETIDLKTWK